MFPSELEGHPLLPQRMQELKNRLLCYTLLVNHKKLVTITMITVVIIPPEKKELQALERGDLSSSLSEFHSIHLL